MKCIKALCDATLTTFWWGTDRPRTRTLRATALKESVQEQRVYVECAVERAHTRCQTDRNLWVTAVPLATRTLTPQARHFTCHRLSAEVHTVASCCTRTHAAQKSSDFERGGGNSDFCFFPPASVKLLAAELRRVGGDGSCVKVNFTHLRKPKKRSEGSREGKLWEVPR